MASPRMRQITKITLNAPRDVYYSILRLTQARTRPPSPTRSRA